MEPGGEPMVLGMASDAVLAALATVVPRPRKRANIGLAVATQQEPRLSTGPTQLPPAMAAPPVTTARVWPEPSTISPMQLSFTNQYTVATTTTPRPSTTPQMQLPSILATAQETTARDRPGRSVISPMQLSTKQTAVVDFWFGGDSRGGREVLKYIQEAVRSIKIGVDSLTNKEVVRELAAAVGRRVNIMLVVDLKNLKPLVLRASKRSLRLASRCAIARRIFNAGLQFSTARYSSKGLRAGRKTARRATAWTILWCSLDRSCLNLSVNLTQCGMKRSRH